MIEKFKVLIVDDEESTRELIRMSIDWELLGYQIVGEANNAEEALEIIEIDPPDLVLTDIYMPYMDGIELSERILNQYPEMKIIIISGHDDFEYAQRGIKAGVYDFIVKPIDEDEIEETIKKVYSEIKNEREMKANYGWIKEQLKKELPYLKEKFLVDLLQSHIEEQDYNRRKNFTNIKVLSSFFQIIIIEILLDNSQVKSLEKQGSYLGYMYIDNIRMIMEDLPGVEVFMDNTNNIVILNSNKMIIKEMIKKIELIKRRMLSHTGIGLMIGIGGWYEGFNKIRISYKEATEALAYKIVSGINQIITYDDLIIAKRTEDNFTEAWQDKLSLYIKGGVLNEAQKIIDQVFKKIMHQDSIEIKFLRLRAIQIVTLVINAMAEIGMNIDEKKLGGGDAFEEIFHANALPTIKVVVKTYVEVACSLVNLEHVKKQKSIIDKINQHVEEHIKEQLSLNIISQEFHLNKSYLSRIYKERTGITLGEFILSQRMEQSIILLKTTDKKAYEIAEEVGYADPNYFGNSFKKYTGKSISEFRKINGNIKQERRVKDE